MQNAALAALGLNWRYLAFDVDPSHLAQALEGARQMRFIGLNLTVPHKLLACQWVDELDESASRWGAVNTIRFETKGSDGHWVPLGQVSMTGINEVRSHGFNTDADAIVRSIREDLAIEFAGARILLLGAGGAGRTAALRLAAEGVARLHIINRTREKAISLAREINREHPRVTVSVDYPESTVDLVLNATSLGLKSDDPLPLDLESFPLKRAGSVYDMVYRPAETRFLALARAEGCRGANGLGMLLYQGAKALELWTGQTAPIEIMKRALESNVYGNL